MKCYGETFERVLRSLWKKASGHAPKQSLVLVWRQQTRRKQRRKWKTIERVMNNKTPRKACVAWRTRTNRFENSNRKKWGANERLWTKLLGKQHWKPHDIVWQARQTKQTKQKNSRPSWDNGITERARKRELYDWKRLCLTRRKRNNTTQPTANATLKATPNDINKSYITLPQFRNIETWTQIIGRW